VTDEAGRTTTADEQSQITPGGVITRRGSVTPFEVHLDVFSGPFDLLLGLISKHKLDITEIALAQVTDEFIAHIKAAQSSDTEWDLGQASEFLLIAATLLDLKSARLLPQTGPQDEEDLALIEARDLLFARLLQYRAFKDIAFTFGERMATAGRMTPRQAGLEPQFARLLPELVMGITPEQLAMIAARAMVPKVAPSVGLDHLHAPQVSVREQAGILATMYDGRTLHSREVVASVVEHFGDQVFHTVISRTVKFPDATLAAEPITTYASTHGAAASYRQLARELIARGGAA
jgi:segregation and condensation protein A